MIPHTAIFLPMAVLLAACVSPVPEVLHCQPIIQNGTRHVSVQSRTHWNDTGIILRKGRTYQFTASGTWTDLIMKCDADGPLLHWQDRFMSRFRQRLRLPPDRDSKSNYFTLIGCIGRGIDRTPPKHSFVIGRGCTITASENGVLFAFANDDPGAYWNNCGSVELSVTAPARNSIAQSKLACSRH